MARIETPVLWRKPPATAIPRAYGNRTEVLLYWLQVPQIPSGLDAMAIRAYGVHAAGGMHTYSRFAETQGRLSGISVR
jgi:hypothetical protein